MFNSDKNKNSPNKENPSSTNQPDTVNDNSQSKAELVNVTDNARVKIIELIHGAESPVSGIRLLAEATSPVNPEYSLAFVQKDEIFGDDTILDYQDFKIYIDSDSLPLMDNVQLDFITSGMGGGFRIAKKTLQTKVDGPLAEKLQKVIEEQINPALAVHGGHIQLLDVKGSTAYIELGGGCKGCGMADVTLKQGIEVMIKQNIPEITEILDSTDHASGKNPFYQPSK